MQCSARPPSSPDAASHDPSSEVGANVSVPATVDEEVQELLEAHDAAFASLFSGPPPRHRVGRYELRRELGHGAAGTVFLAFDTDLERPVALKLLDPELYATTRDTSRRLVQEAKLLARLSHPNVVRVYEAAVDPDLYIAMEYVDGSTLRAYANKGRSPRQLLHAYLAAGQGLAAVHRLGLVHRDFKPDNVLVSREGAVKIADFGIALQCAARADPPGFWAASSMAGPPLSTAVGTPKYMAPEQRRYGVVDPRADQFSFCIALFEAMVGQHPRAVALNRHDNLKPGFHGVDCVARPDEYRCLFRQVRRVLPRAATRALLTGLSSHPDQRWSAMEPLLARLCPVTRTRKARLAPVTAAAMLAAALSAPYSATQGPTIARVCEDVSLGELWTAETRAQVTSRFQRSTRPHALRTAQRVTERLTDHVQAWDAERNGLCEDIGTRPEHVAEILGGLACLIQQADEIRGLVDYVITADELPVDDALVATAGLPAPSSCRGDVPADAAALYALRADWPVSLREQLHRARYATQFGHVREGLSLAEELVAGLDEVHERPEPPGLRAAALAVVGEALVELGRFDEALQTLWAAVEADNNVDGAPFAARTWAHIVHVTNHSSEPVEALSIGRTARTDPRYASSRPVVKAELWNAEAGVHAALGDLATARELYQRTLEARTDALGRSSMLVAEVLLSLGNLERKAGAPERAYAYLSRALTILEPELGRHHPRYGYILIHLGLTALRLNDNDRAQQHLAGVPQLWRDVFGDDAPRVQVANGLHGVALSRAGQHADARELLDRALPVARKSAPRYLPMLLFALAQSEHERAPERALALAAEARLLAQTNPSCVEGTADAVDAWIASVSPSR